MPGACAGSMARGPSGGTACWTCPTSTWCSPCRTWIATIAFQNQTVVYDIPIPGSVRDVAHHRRRSGAISGRRDRLPSVQAAHLGTKFVAPSAYLLQEISGFGLSRYRGSRRCHRLGTVRIWVTPETSPQSLATDPGESKGSCGLRPGQPAKGRRPLETIHFRSSRSGTNVVTLDDWRWGSAWNGCLQHVPF